MSGQVQPMTMLVMAGGTGGHVFPALAAAAELQARGIHIEWLGTRAGIEAELVPQRGIAINYINVAGLRGKGVKSLLLAPFKLIQALWQALRVVRKTRPVAVLGMGGFATGPGGIAAWLLGKPLVIHEQNAIAGMTNRWLAKVARRVLEAFPGTFAASAKVTCVGNPVRAEITQLAAPAARLSERQGPLRVLVLGGSLGATALNDLVPQALALLAEQVAAHEQPQVRHQTGKRNYDTAVEAYRQAGVSAEISAFVDDMAAAYGWADVVICRSGALTVSEIASAGLASFLVPYPHAVDDHQTANAQFLAEAGAARICQQVELTAQILMSWLHEMVGNRAQVTAQAERARSLACADAAKQVAEHCLQTLSAKQYGAL